MNSRNSNKSRGQILAFLMFCLSASVLRADSVPIIRVDNGEFVLGSSTEVFKGVGLTVYPFANGNYDYALRILKRAKANGVRVIRAVNMLMRAEGDHFCACFLHYG